MAWREVSRTDLGEWNRRLLREAAASIRQYPLLNEGLRGSGGLWVSIPGRYAALIAWGRRWTTIPRYLVHSRPDGTTSFACIVTIGVRGLRFGCLLDGPVTMDGRPTEPLVVQDLLTWARRNQYVALRLTHSSEAHLHALAALGSTDRIDGVPFYPYPMSELYVELVSDEAKMLGGFQAVARRNIRQAREAGYAITADCSPCALEKAWPAFQSRSASKGITYRDLETYKRIMREAEPDGAARLYTAWREGVPIAAILILRDCTTAHYFLGTIDTDALGGAPSPACLLHWSAMRDAQAMGCSFYNLGTRSGPVYTFKAKFRPVEHERPAPLTFAIRPRLYALWRRLLPAVTRAVT
jgi:Acetyltransferase (GNAT) domain